MTFEKMFVSVGKLGIKRRSESMIETLLSGQRGNVFSISESVLFIISIFKEGCRNQIRGVDIRPTHGTQDSYTGVTLLGE